MVLGGGVGWLVVLLAYAIVLALIAVVAYLVLRFAIRDALRGHALWQERRERSG